MSYSQHIKALVRDFGHEEDITISDIIEMAKEGEMYLVRKINVTEKPYHIKKL